MVLGVLKMDNGVVVEVTNQNVQKPLLSKDTNVVVVIIVMLHSLMLMDNGVLKITNGVVFHPNVNYKNK